MAESVLQLCVIGVVLIGVVAFLVICFQAIADFLRDLLSPKTVRTVLRSLKRFRLRTLLGFVAVVQIFMAIALWQTNRPGALPVCFVALGCIFFVLWMIWACLSDTVDSLSSTRLRRFGKTRRITVPASEDPNTKPLGDDKSADVAPSQSRKTLCRQPQRSLSWPVLEESEDSAPRCTSCGKRTNE